MGGMTMMMDFREAIACLNEYRNSLANICRMLKPSDAQGELGEALRELDERLLELLDDEKKDALRLLIIIWEKLPEIIEEVVDLPEELPDLLVALNQLKLGINEATEARAEYLRKSEANNVTERGISTAEAIEEFMRKQRLRFKEEWDEKQRNRSQKTTSELAEPICATAKNRGATIIRLEPSDSAGTRAAARGCANENSEVDPGEECGSRANYTDDTEALLNWVAGLDRTSVIAVLSMEAEAAQLSVQRFASQPAKLREAMDQVDRVNRILSFFRDGSIAPDMSEHEVSLCKSFEDKMPVRDPS
jgi:hypothetical protein